MNNKGKITFLWSEGGDWVGVYLDGKLLQEGHKVNARELVIDLGYEQEYIEKSDGWFNKNGGHCPEEIK